MKIVFKFLMFISAISIVAMEQDSIKLTTNSENPFLRFVGSRSINWGGDVKGPRQLYFWDVSKEQDQFKEQCYYFPAEGLEHAEATINKKEARSYLYLFYETRIECWMRKGEEDKPLLHNTIKFGDDADKYVALSDDEQYVVKQNFHNGKRIFKVYQHDGSLISRCELPSLYTEEGRWIKFNRANTIYAVHLKNNVYNGSRWYIIDIATGKVLDTRWTTNQITFAEDSTIQEETVDSFTYANGASSVVFPMS